MNYGPYARALLVALDPWVTEGVAPPPTTFPNLQSHTLLPLAKVHPRLSLEERYKSAQD
jgi:hypothetical protein